MAAAMAPSASGVHPTRPVRGSLASQGQSQSPSTPAAPSGGSSTLADLTSCVRRTKGDLPPPMVGSSVTVIEDHVYVFGGRLIPTRTMVSTLYVLSLRTLEWTRAWPPENDNGRLRSPDPRYFHSAEVWGHKLVIWGGEGYAASTDESMMAPLRTLNDLCIFDCLTGTWDFPTPTCAPGIEPPAPRYAHLSAITTYAIGPPKAFGTEADNTPASLGEKTKTVMVIMGGQDIRNTYIHSVNILDLDEMRWVKTGNWDRHIGTYRAVAVCAKWTVIPGGPTPAAMFDAGTVGTARRQGSIASTSRAITPSPLSATTMEERQRLAMNGAFGPAGARDSGQGLAKGETLMQLSASDRAAVTRAEPIFLYSNHNFTDVRRDLDMLGAPIPNAWDLDAISLSKQMSGTALPPGLRFPTGTIVGRHMLVFGTFLSHQLNNFAIWALDLGKHGGAGVKDAVREKEKDVLTWQRVDPGNILNRGSWNRAVTWKNSVIVFGDRERDISEDYDHRQMNFKHIVSCDLEAFGIYQPPPQPLPPMAQSFGLYTLSQAALADFEIICSDGKRLGCSRRLLEDRWKWFKSKMADYDDKVDQLPEESPVLNESTSSSVANGGNPVKGKIRIRPRTLNLPEPSNVVLAFLQYLYTLSLTTPLQHSLPILMSLLVFSRAYEEANLRALCVHALHEALNSGQWPAVSIYEAATLGSCYALQIRSLKILMAQSKAAQTPRKPLPDLEGGNRRGGAFDHGGGDEEPELRAKPERPPPKPLSPAPRYQGQDSSSVAGGLSFPTVQKVNPLPTPPSTPRRMPPLPTPPSAPRAKSPRAVTPRPTSPRSVQSSASSQEPMPSPDVSPKPVPLWSLIPLPSPPLSPPSPGPNAARSRSQSIPPPPKQRHRPKMSTASSPDFRDEDPFARIVPVSTSSSSRSAAQLAARRTAPPVACTHLPLPLHAPLSPVTEASTPSEPTASGRSQRPWHDFDATPQVPPAVEEQASPGPSLDETLASSGESPLSQGSERFGLLIQQQRSPWRQSLIKDQERLSKVKETSSGKDDHEWPTFFGGSAASKPAAKATSIVSNPLLIHSALVAASANRAAQRKSSVPPPSPRPGARSPKPQQKLTPPLMPFADNRRHSFDPRYLSSVLVHRRSVDSSHSRQSFESTSASTPTLSCAGSSQQDLALPTTPPNAPIGAPHLHTSPLMLPTDAFEEPPRVAPLPPFVPLEELDVDPQPLAAHNKHKLTKQPALIPVEGDPKVVRRQAEFDLGARLLRQAGASELEVKFRAAAVGFAEMEKLRGPKGERGAKTAPSPYIGGAPLKSEFSD